MAKDFARKFYNSKSWEICRLSFIAKRRDIDGGLCQQCKKKLGYIVHHKVTLTPANITDRNISLNHSNLMYVCKDCHDIIHDSSLHGRKETRCTFDEAGNPILKRDTPLFEK